MSLRELVGRNVRINRGDLPTALSTGAVSQDCCHTLPGRTIDRWVADCNHLEEQTLLTRIVPHDRHCDVVKRLVMMMR